MPSKNPPPDKSVLRDIPPLPGVYRFLDGDGRALYVGKAANLKKRASSYFGKNLSPRMRLMMGAMRGVEVTVAASEHAALLLENRLIKTLRPRYNILFRDDKSYPFLRLTAHAYPRLMFYRGDKIGGGEESFYGPFPDSRAVRKTVNILQRVFRLRTCSDSVFSGRSRPCLLHGIGRCSAPCVNKISPARYAADVGAARRLLSGDSRGVESDLRSQMESAAARLEFESAAALRDRLRALAVVRARHFVDGDDSHPDADYAGVCASGGAVCVNVVSVRGGRRLGERRFFGKAVWRAARRRSPARHCRRLSASITERPKTRRRFFANAPRRRQLRRRCSRRAERLKNNAPARRRKTPASHWRCGRRSGLAPPTR